MKTDVHKLLKEKKLKVTSPRKAVLALLYSSDTPLSVQDIVKSVKDIHEVTVYRTLHSLVSVKLAKKITFSEGAFLYERADDHHHHIVCTSCGLTEDIKDSTLEKQLKEKVTSSFIRIYDHTLEFFGVCRKCEA